MAVLAVATNDRSASLLGSPALVDDFLLVVESDGTTKGLHPRR